MKEHKEKVYNAQICDGGRLRIETEHNVASLRVGDKFRIVKKDTTFTCDNVSCGKKAKLFDGRFPYENNWVYLYNFGYKLASNKENTIKDKHFCCKACLLEYLRKQMEGQLICLFG
jgi:hypothetical protein